MKGRGYSLLELLVVMAISSIILLGMVEVMSTGSAASLKQDRQAQAQENTRLAVSTLRKAIRPAGFSPSPWLGSTRLTNPLEGSLDELSSASDRLVTIQWSNVNCFDHQNPEKDVSGKSKYYLRETQIDLTGSAQLALQCRYGPTSDTLVTQIRRQGRIPGIKGLEFEYGEDLNHDGRVETWSPAGAWTDPEAVLGIKVMLEVENDQKSERLELITAIPGQTV